MSNMLRSPFACPICPASRRPVASPDTIRTAQRSHILSATSAAANAKEYEAEDKNPLLIIPGVKIGKQGLEKTLETYLRGVPGGQRVEVTARGKLVQELDPKPDRSGQTVQLTIDQGLQQYAARRMGDQSGALVAMDVANGDMLAFVSMPAFDPNSFSEGIGRTEWKMLSGERPHPAAEQGGAGALSVRLDDQAGDGAGVPEAGHRSQAARSLPRRLSDRKSLLPMRRGPRIDGHAFGRSNAAATPISGPRASSPIPQQTTEMVNYLGYGQEFDLPIPIAALRHDAEPEMAREEISPRSGRATIPPIRRSARDMCSSTRCSWRSCRRGWRPESCFSRGC